MDGINKEEYSQIANVEDREVAATFLRYKQAGSLRNTPTEPLLSGASPHQPQRKSPLGRFMYKPESPSRGEKRPRDVDRSPAPS